jgi:hypothetical protein
MSNPPTDYDQDYALADLLGAPCLCEICKQECTLDGDNNYCTACQELVDALDANEALSCADVVRILQDEVARRDLPLLQPITVRPVELNAKLWAEWKRIAEGIE